MGQRLRGLGLVVQEAELHSQLCSVQQAASLKKCRFISVCRKTSLIAHCMCLMLVDHFLAFSDAAGISTCANI